MVWAVAGGILFLPCALVLLAFAASLGPFAIIVVLAIVTTVFGAHLYLTGARLLLDGRPGWGLRLAFAPLATWNILIMLSWLPMLPIFLGFPPSSVEAFFAACGALHILVNAAFLLALPFVRPPAPAQSESL